MLAKHGQQYKNITLIKLAEFCFKGAICKNFGWKHSRFDVSVLRCNVQPQVKNSCSSDVNANKSRLPQAPSLDSQPESLAVWLTELSS